MGIIFKSEKRRIIPKWRSIEIATGSGELNPTAKKTLPKPFELNLLKEQEGEYLKDKNIYSAGDLLSSAYVLGFEKDFKSVAKFVLDLESDQDSSLISLAKKVLELDKLSSDVVNKVAELNFLENKYAFDINRYKSYLKKEPKNPLAWIELGRLYSLINKKDKAKRCVDSALFLDCNNRFIVRSASRFYHHIDADKEKAISIIKKSKFLDNDPWLMSAEIAYSSIIGRFSTMTDKGIYFLKNKIQNDSDITELASALGTLEFSNGKLKNAKRYFTQSLIKPNDNSVAQAKWMSDDIQGLDVNVDKYHLPRALEADAIVSVEKKDYKKALQNSLDWISDEPYSTRPVKLAAYLSSVFLKDTNSAVELLKNGLVSNPNDMMLNNNLVYHLIRGNRTDEAMKIFHNKLLNKLNDLEDVSKLTLTATTGLLLYRDGANEQGKELYQNAIRQAKATGNEYLVALATVNYIKEEVNFIKEKAELNVQITYLNNYIKHHESPDIEIFYNEFLAKYNKF